MSAVAGWLNQKKYAAFGSYDTERRLCGIPLRGESEYIADEISRLEVKKRESLNANL